MTARSLMWLAVSAGLLATAAAAQDIPTLDAPPSPKARQRSDPQDAAAKKQETAARAAAFEAESLRAFQKGDLKAAEAALRAQLELQPDNFVTLYNLACCRATGGDVKEGMEFLQKAIENGFTDKRQLTRDGMLRNLQTDPGFKRIIDNWPAVLIARRDANLKGLSEQFKKGYTNANDDALRLTYRSAFDENSAVAARAELRQIAQWADTAVFGDLLDPVKMADDPWVIVVLPNRQDFVRWIVALYGPGVGSGNSTIGGSYEHDAKRLVSMDLGSSLRHEFFHVLHWRDMTRRGQFHPIWIMEGLCSLIEDYDTDSRGGLHPTASWRSNTVKRLEKLAKLEPIEVVAALNPAEFSGQRPLARYAEARTIFLYLFDTGHLKAWYDEYTRTYREDRTGIKAMETVLGKTIKDINKDYKAWVRLLPEVPEQIEPGMASLGIEIDAGAGEGPVVASVSRRRVAAGTKGSFRIGDVITSIDHRATRDIAELVRVLGPYKVGQVVEVAYRRGRNYGVAEVELVPRE